MWWSVALVICLVIKILCNTRVSRGLARPPRLRPPMGRTSESFGLFDVWYASHPAPHQHAHVFVLHKDMVVKDIKGAIAAVVYSLGCLRVCMVPQPLASPVPLEFGLLSMQKPLPIFFTKKHWKDVLRESVDDSMVREDSYLWRVHVIEPNDDEIIFVFTFHHLVTDGQGALDVLSYFLHELVPESPCQPSLPDVAFGPPLETVRDIRPTVGFMLRQLFQDKTATLFPAPVKFPKEETFKELSELTTGMEFIEIGPTACKTLTARCKEHQVTINSVIAAAHMFAYATIKKTDNSPTDFVDLLCAISLRKDLNVDLPRACGSNYLSAVTFGRHIKKEDTKKIKTLLNNRQGNVNLLWELARTLGKEHKDTYKDNATNIGLTVWIDDTIRNWMLKKSRENKFYGRSTVLGLSNLTRIDSHFSSPSRSDKISKAVKAAWFAQSNIDATGPLLESCVETFGDHLRIVSCYLKPAMSTEEAKAFADALEGLLNILSL